MASCSDAVLNLTLLDLVHLQDHLSKLNIDAEGDVIIEIGPCHDLQLTSVLLLKFWPT